MNDTRYQPGRCKRERTYAKTKAQISLAVTAKLISAFVFAPRIVLSKYKISNLLPSSVTVQPGLCWT